MVEYVLIVSATLLALLGADALFRSMFRAHFSRIAGIVASPFP